MSGYTIDHVALLVRRIEDAVERLGLDADPSAAEEFPGEGTRELYVGDAASAGRLLLMQPIGPGPYERAMRTRGPGLHHVAIAVPGLREFATSIEDSGWLLHPASLRTMDTVKQIWLCRPGVQTLVEVSEGARRYRGDSLVERVIVAIGPGAERVVEALGARELHGVVDGVPLIHVGGRTIDVNAALRA